MTKTKVRAGIAGSGFAARFHCDALRRVTCADVELVGAYSTTREKLDQFTAACSIKSFYSLEQLIDAVDVVHVCTPPATHEAIAVQALKANKHVVIEKPLTGYFGDGTEGFDGTTFPRELGLRKSIESIRNMLNAEQNSDGRIMYAENWIYAPAIQKEREVIAKTNAQILWMQAQQAHSGSHSVSYGDWRLSGGGSLMGKGCHPLAACLYLKRVEGRSRNGKAIRPVSVSARTHALTRMPGYRNEGHLRDAYKDVEDYASVHLIFEDGTIADITASELLQGGVKNFLEVHANNHRTICNIAPNDSMLCFNPVEKNFDGIYVVEKTGSKQGWSFISPDEAWSNGYQHEMEAFYRSVAFGEPIESDSALAADVIATIYSAYHSAEQGGKEVKVDAFTLQERTSVL